MKRQTGNPPAFTAIQDALLKGATEDTVDDIADRLWEQARQHHRAIIAPMADETQNELLNYKSLVSQIMQFAKARPQDADMRHLHLAIARFNEHGTKPLETIVEETTT